MLVFYTRSVLQVLLLNCGFGNVPYPDWLPTHERMYSKIPVISFSDKFRIRNTFSSVLLFWNPVAYFKSRLMHFQPCDASLCFEIPFSFGFHSPLFIPSPVFLNFLSGPLSLDSIFRCPFHLFTQRNFMNYLLCVLYCKNIWRIQKCRQQRHCPDDLDL